MRYKHLAELNNLVEQKLISCRPHPTLPLCIYNYTAGAQAVPIHAWSEALQDCRGLILDAGGNVVGRPFKKFWNYEPNSDILVNGEVPLVYEKMDGSLFIACEYQGHLVTATRGSFESEQAQKGREILRDRFPGWWPGATKTWCFEVLYPANRIVLDYGALEDLVLLAVFEQDGTELDLNMLVHSFRRPKMYKFHEVEKILSKRASLG